MDNVIKKEFNCPNCSESFCYISALESHMQTHVKVEEENGSNVSYKCQLCPQTFTNSYILREHVETHTANKHFVCDVCCKVFRSRQYMRKHKLRHFNKFSCDICPKTFSFQVSLNKHMRTHAEKSTPFSYWLPKKVFARPKLNLHKTDGALNCTVGSKSFRNAMLLGQHRICHSTFGRKTYSKCNTTVPKLELHGKNLTTITHFTCSQCNTNFPSQLELSEHTKLCEQKNEVCEYCFRKFPTQITLVNHMQIKDGRFLCQKLHENFLEQQSFINQYLCCRFCKLLFSNTDQLYAHQVTHTLRNTFTCPFCWRICESELNLQIHRDYCVKKTDYLCEICFQNFPKPMNLRRHRLIHTGERPFSCEICSEAFTTNCSLFQHQRIHTLENAIECEVCRRKLHDSQDILLHEKKHSIVISIQNLKFSGVNVSTRRTSVRCNIPFGASNFHPDSNQSDYSLYKCDLCGDAFAKESALISHRKMHIPVIKSFTIPKGKLPLPKLPHPISPALPCIGLPVQLELQQPSNNICVVTLTSKNNSPVLQFQDFPPKKNCVIQKPCLIAPKKPVSSTSNTFVSSHIIFHKRKKIQNLFLTRRKRLKRDKREPKNIFDFTQKLIEQKAKMTNS